VRGGSVSCPTARWCVSLAGALWLQLIPLPIRTKALSGFVWGLVVGPAFALKLHLHPAWTLLLGIVLNLVAAFGLCANGALLLLKLFTGRLRQVVGYLLGGAALAVLLVGLNLDATVAVAVAWGAGDGGAVGVERRGRGGKGGREAGREE
jgi:hypothetical protein